jgi:hypothetical protein
MPFQLKKLYRDKISNDIELQARIAKVCGRNHAITVKRWADENSIMLTCAGVVMTVAEYLQIDSRVSLIEKI